MRRWWGSLAGRIALLTTAVAVVTALVAGLLAKGLIERANETSARRTLSRLADISQASADLGVRPSAGQQRARRTLETIGIQSVTVSEAGTVVASNALARQAVNAADRQRLLAGTKVSASRTVTGRQVYVEGRPTRAGGIVLVQRRSDALAVGQAAITRLLWALLVAVALAVAMGLFVASRLSRPLHTAASATRALAQGQRDVVVPVGGPLEVAEVARAVNSLAAALRHSEGRQREFLLSVSHDLRTPLTAISGYAESLTEGVIPPEDAPQAGAVMLAESRRLARLVSDLLDLARLDAQEFRVELGTVDLAQLAQEAAQVWSRRCAGAEVRFALQVASGELPVVADAMRLRQVVDGLLENALRVTPAGAPIVLAAWSDRVAGCGVVEVRDGGPGLTDDDLAVAFERSALYERYRGVRQVGTGLGLAIVHGLVARQGGTVEAGRAPEGGARFTVRLPAAASRVP